MSRDGGGDGVGDGGGCCMSLEGGPAAQWDCKAAHRAQQVHHGIPVARSACAAKYPSLTWRHDRQRYHGTPANSTQTSQTGLVV